MSVPRKSWSVHWNTVQGLHTYQGTYSVATPYLLPAMNLLLRINFDFYSDKAK